MTQQYYYPYGEQKAPVSQLKTNRSLSKYILLNIVTLGVWGVVCMTCLADDVNDIATKHDGAKTTNFLLSFIVLSPITLGIYFFVWNHNFAKRIRNELIRRKLDISFGARDFWLYGVLGSFVIVGPFVYVKKLFDAVNALSEHYNVFG